MEKVIISKTRYIACVAVLSAISFVLMLIDFPIPSLIPSFVQMDFSETPALIGSFALGPLAGVLICLFKNLIHLSITTTSCVGELCNFLIGILLVVPAGLIYRYKKTRLGALIACVVGSVVAGLGSFPINLFISYPFYYNFMPKEAILSAYQVILPSVDSIEKCLIAFNTPFTFAKGIFDSIITFVIYKSISPLIKGYNLKKIKKSVEPTDDSTENETNKTETEN